jgi:hypothetical protein
MELRPTPEEIVAAADRLRESVVFAAGADPTRIVADLMINDPRLERFRAELEQLAATITEQQAEILDLYAQVHEWLCPGCRSVFNGPPQGKTFDIDKAFLCPHCASTCRPHLKQLLIEEREQRAASDLAHEMEVGAYREVAEQAQRGVAAIAEREHAFLIQVAEDAHEYHKRAFLDREVDWQQCTHEPCVALREATRPREGTEEQQRAKDAYERVTRGS